jgi:PAT family beta-lactamase induction signal transducer AmpG
MRETKRIFLEFFKKKYIWIYFAFILFYRFAEGLVIKIVPLFLNAPLDQQGMGLTEQQIGLYYGTFGVIAFVVGSILGGYFISWLKLRRALFPLVCIFNVPFVVYALLAWFQPSSPVLICAAIVFEYFSYGFGFVGLTLFIMQQVAPGSHQMAHYAFGSSLANLGVMLPGMISGWLCDSLGGYHYFFMWALLATVPAFLLAARIPFTYPDTEEVTAEEVDKELINE